MKLIAQVDHKSKLYLSLIKLKLGEVKLFYFKLLRQDNIKLLTFKNKGQELKMNVVYVPYLISFGEKVALGSCR